MCSSYSGDRGSLTSRRPDSNCGWTGFESPDDFREFFKRCYGPTIVTYRNIADDPARIDALDRELAELAARHGRDDGGFVMEWEYLLVTAQRSTKDHS